VPLPVIELPAVASAAGSARIPLPIAAGLDGATLSCQWFVFDPAGAALGASAVSQGLEVLIGR